MVLTDNTINDLVITGQMLYPCTELRRLTWESGYWLSSCLLPLDISLASEHQCRSTFLTKLLGACLITGYVGNSAPMAHVSKCANSSQSWGRESVEGCSSIDDEKASVVQVILKTLQTTGTINSNQSLFSEHYMLTRVTFNG